MSLVNLEMTSSVLWSFLDLEVTSSRVFLSQVTFVLEFCPPRSDFELSFLEFSQPRSDFETSFLEPSDLKVTSRRGFSRQVSKMCACVVCSRFERFRKSPKSPEKTLTPLKPVQPLSYRYNKCLLLVVVVFLSRIGIVRSTQLINSTKLQNRAC